MKQFVNGVNLGGWLSQYRHYDHGHFKTFITQSDINRIAKWGFDHVRLPVDYPVLESDDSPGKYREDGFQYIDACMEWCRSAGLGLLFDLHHAPGYSFTNDLQPETRHLNVLFTQEAAQQRFMELWKAIVSRYHTAGLSLVFELLNEAVLPESGPWNTLAHRTVAALRQISQTCTIMIGGNRNNAAAELKNIALLEDDPHVVYTFHFYEPFLFTHQNAPWVDITRSYDQVLDYPGEHQGLADFIAKQPQFEAPYGWLAERKIDRALLEQHFQPVVDFINQSGHVPYCGEFGVIECAPDESRRRWHADLIDVLNQYGIGRAVWSYKAMSFGLVDRDGVIRDPALINILTGI